MLVVLLYILFFLEYGVNMGRLDSHLYWKRFAAKI